MMIHQQNSYASRSQQCTGYHEALSREQVNKVKKNSIIAVVQQVKYHKIASLKYPYISN
jgi:hypothetical protein